ncbi:hypothetical protein Tco_1015675 [Tanacetum coccineum]|uniref:Uncharacterized protein n=1 Tax=Tanacetum coccineum TaxID=301880 RepID=A0ABQ5FLK2_9ASTR
MDLLALTRLVHFGFSIGDWSILPPIHYQRSRNEMSIDKVVLSRDNETSFCERNPYLMAGKGLCIASWSMMSFSSETSMDCACPVSVVLGFGMSIAMAAESHSSKFCFFDIQLTSLSQGTVSLQKVFPSIRHPAWISVEMPVSQSQNPLDTRTHVMVPLLVI